MNNKAFSRKDRVADAVLRAISKILQEDFKDPRLGFVSVLEVDVSPDLTNAKVYVTFMELEKTLVFLKILNDAAGFFRSELSRLLKLRVAPKPRFIFDDSMLKGNRINTLLDNL